MHETSAIDRLHAKQVHIHKEKLEMYEHNLKLQVKNRIADVSKQSRKIISIPTEDGHNYVRDKQ